MRFPYYLKPSNALVTEFEWCKLQYNFLTDIFNLIYLCFTENVLRVHLCTEVNTASWMLEPFVEKLGEMFLNNFDWEKMFDK